MSAYRHRSWTGKAIIKSAENVDSTAGKAEMGAINLCFARIDPDHPGAGAMAEAVAQVSDGGNCRSRTQFDDHCCARVSAA